MSSLSGGNKEGKILYIKLILYQSQFCETSLNIKNIFPYGISIQFDNNPEKYMEPIKNINEIFNSSKNEFKYFINNNNQKHSIKINCFIKSIFILKKKFASVKIAINTNNINKNNKEKNEKKWYYLKNKNGEVIIKLLLSIDIINISNISENYNNKRYSQNENELGNNISINKPNKINIHFNSIANNNLNGFSNSTYMSTSHYISSSNNSLKSSSTQTNNSNLSNPIINNTNIIINNRAITNSNNINKNNNNLLSSIIEKDDSITICENDTNNDKYGDLNANNLLNTIQNLFKKNNQKIFIRTKNLIQKKQHLGKDENIYFKNRKKIDKEKIKLKNDIKILDKNRQTYENIYLDLIDNQNKFETHFYKQNIQRDLNLYEKEKLLNINNIYINLPNLDEIILEEKMTKNYFGQYSMTKNIKDNEKSVINNYYNNKGYSFESNNFKNSLYLYGNGGNSNKILFNIINDNKSINKYNNNFNIKPSPISFKFKELKKELNVSVSNSNSCSSEKQNTKNNYNTSNKSSKKRLITDYSKSTLNIIDDLIIFDDIQDIKRNKASKSNNIVQNNLALNIDGICNIKNIHNNKNKDNNNKNNKVLKNNNLIDKKNCNYNLATTKKKKNKIKINDDINNNNSYYHLEDKYYSTTTINNKCKNKEIDYLNKKIIPKNIELGNITKKNLDIKKSSEKCINLNNPNKTDTNEKSFKSIFKQKIDNNNNTINYNEKSENNRNILQISKKNENQNNNIFKKINNKKNNRVFKNIFTHNKNKENLKREKICSITPDNLNNKSSNNSFLGINSLLSNKFISLDNNSRNIKYVQYNTNPNLNNKQKKINRNCLILHKKNGPNNEKDNLINHFCYNNETNNNKIKTINKKISFNTFELKKKSINVEGYTKLISKKNTNFNAYNKNNNTIDYNLEQKKEINNKKINKNSSNHINKIIQTKINNSKKITNIDSKIIFNIRKNKTINDYDNKSQNLKNNNKLISNKYNNDDNKNTTKIIKNKVNKIIKK